MGVFPFNLELHFLSICECGKHTHIGNKFSRVRSVGEVQQLLRVEQQMGFFVCCKARTDFQE